ncbi:MAG: DUF6455 family protein [Marivita sp.]|uniref:DUF6455 family protein n=1 Tax=Marivita sp. TaxID=2003365 RepID=UPI0025C44FD1|nr:DUF6455 family protein [Marivita sp.]MCI5110628.1 DUF6455 family protein [Marivita sp.]
MNREDPSVAWKPLGKTGVHYWLVQRMAKTCGVDTARAAEDGDLELEAWADMVQRCRSCQWVDGCERWLSRQRTEAAAPPDDCVNARLLALLAERQDMK